MGSRLQLHVELVKFTPKVYFQPPTGMQLSYPCIVYSKTPKSSEYANNKRYRTLQGYTITVIDQNPDGNIADLIGEAFQYCVESTTFKVDNLNHTTLNLYY